MFSVSGPCREGNQRKINNKENIDREKSSNFMKQSRCLLYFAEANLGQQKVNRIQLVQMRYLGTVKAYIFYGSSSPFRALSLTQFRNHSFTDCTTPWTSDQCDKMPLPKHRTTQTQKKRMHTPNIHALSGIRTHDPRFWASEDSSCLRPRVYCDQLKPILQGLESNIISTRCP
jgi:hypothetical protein